MEDDENSEKAEAFLVEFRALCLKHQVSLHTSLYDSIQIWDLGGDEKELEGSIEGIEDMTK